jgi:hypothetical protein
MSLNWEQYLSNQGYKADNSARQEFGENLMLAFKQKNISEGMQWFQAIHLHARVKDLIVTYPTPAQFPHPSYAEVGAIIGGQTKNVDAFNMIKGGDIETAYFSLLFAQNDPMTSPEHWITEERRQWLLEQMRVWLGW